jgi:methylmalonyl-CoA mutase
MTPPIPLADVFPVFTEDDWRAAVSIMNRGAVRSPHDSVVGGADAGPLFQRRVGARAIAGRPAAQPWRVIQRVDADNAAAAAAAIEDDVAGGATGAEITFAGSVHPLGGRLPADTAAGLAKALRSTLPDNFQLRIDHGGSMAVAEAFLDLAGARKAELVLAFDPIAASAVRGTGSPDEIAERVRVTAKTFDARGVDGAVVIADGRLWHAGGATEEQELAATLATFVAHLRLLEAAGKIRVTLVADSNQFRTIAKFRAMRLLLARVAEVAGRDTPSPLIHAETAWRTMSADDPEMNILRATTATFAAAAGGADSITVLPLDAVAGGTNGHARRLARNTQTILAEEAHLFRVADPGAGSGAIETLTATFAETAWKRFQTIEKEGGMLAAIAGGSPSVAFMAAK